MKERILVVCEKPTAARRIAHALDDDGAPEAYDEGGVPLFIAGRGDFELVVVSALGHLFSIAQDGGKWTYPVYKYSWVPAHDADKRQARTKRFIQAIERASKGATGYVSACDLDMEGSLIAYMVLLNVCGEGSLNEAKRMRYSTLTERDLIRAWEGMSPTLDYPLIEAGRTRHEVDWLFGINLTRALSLSLKNASGIFKTLSIGRVQGPTLNFVKEREVEVKTHVPTPFWVIKAETTIEGRRIPLDYTEARIGKKSDARKVVRACQGKDGVISTVSTRRVEQPPPPPFSLGDLQREAFSKFRYTPRTTLNSAERLYLSTHISYPRTSSQKIPPTIDVRGILEGLRRRKEYTRLAASLLKESKLRPMQGAKDDPAHPAIHPTGTIPGMITGVDARVYDLICRRFMASLSGPALRENVSAKVTVDAEGSNYAFFLRGTKLVEDGWIKFYEPYVKEKGSELPKLSKGQKVPFAKLRSLERYTKPPARFNPGSLLRLMEDEGLGTKATRTDIVDTLFKRGYVKGSTTEITDLGFTIIENLERYVPDILSVEMTRSLEEDMGRIQRGEFSRANAITKTVEVLESTLSGFKAHEVRIGSEISGAITREEERSSYLGRCPGCGDGHLRIIVNKKTGKRFAGCSNYFAGKCTTSYPLPQRGRITTTEISCSECGAPIIKATLRGMSPWELCINIDCPSKRGGSTDE
ncbi:DNA topoisomerase I [Candidatus Bathyarchaeota archaeon]|nr:DNA topoisomerase I [Candidatus Bathyarchaeota archaeon]